MMAVCGLSGQAHSHVHKHTIIDLPRVCLAVRDTAVLSLHVLINSTLLGQMRLVRNVLCCE